MSDSILTIWFAAEESGAGAGEEFVMDTALTGMWVVEAGERIALGYAGKLLAELGATVVKVEPPGGDGLRRRADGGDLVAEGLFSYLHAAKRTVAIDTASAAGRETMLALVGRADVVLADGTIPVEDTPAVVEVSDFGRTGPWRDRPATGLTVQAAAGWIIWRGQAGDEPVQVGGEPEEYVAGAYTAVAALVVARARERLAGTVTGPTEVSVMAALHGAIPYHEVRGGADPTMLDLAARPFPLTIMRASDGWVGLNCLTGQQWQDACALLGVPEYAGRREELRADPEALRVLRELVQPRFDAWTVAEVVELAQAFRIPAAALGTAETILASPHLRERGFFVRNEVAGREFEQPGSPYRMSATPPRTSTGTPELENATAS